jgi:hypothetical protein
MSRVNPFENLSDEFSVKLKTQKQTVENEKDLINQIAEENNFPSRQPSYENTASPSVKQQRRYRTGRNQQLNIKATEQTISKFYRLADEQHITLAELLERALDALEKSQSK